MPTDQPLEGNESSAKEIGPTLAVLDCTLRDGGFYTNWDFDRDFLTAYAASADAAGIDFIEVGYRSLKRAGYRGAHKYSGPFLLESIPPLSRARLSVMVDAKELEDRETDVRRLFDPSEESRISMVRTATRLDTLESTVEQVARLGALGYDTTINLMMFGSLSESDAKKAIEAVGESSADVLYLADSYGTMLPEDVERSVALCSSITEKPLGLHLHNNLELAFANALIGVEHGVEYIDASITGMGRGAGNLKTELFVQYVQRRLGVRGYRTEPLYEFIEERMTPLRSRHGWGPSLPYMLSGYLGVHPFYAQELIGSERYTVREVISLLESIHRSGEGISFSRDVLDRAISGRSRPPDAFAGGVEESQSHRPLPDLDWSNRQVVVVGRGPSATRHQAAINEYLKRYNPVVVECNHLPGIQAVEEHFCAFLVLANVLSLARPALESGKKLILGFPYFPDGSVDDLVDDGRIYFEPYEVRGGELDVGRPVIPYDVVSMYGIALAIRCGARKLRLVGFDGYASSHSERDQRMQREMLDFFGVLGDRHPEVDVRSLLDTSYGVPTESIYGVLFHGGEQ